MNTFLYFFAWPTGAVWGNFLASLIWGLPAFIHIKRKLKHIIRKQNSVTNII